MEPSYGANPENRKPSTTLIQSYVLKKWFVSTIHRESSVMESPPPWFYETLVWEWNAETRERGELLYQAGGSHYESGGLLDHFEVCKQLTETGSYREADNEI